MSQADVPSPQGLVAETVPVPVKLAALWTTFMFLYVYVDILGLYLPGVVEDILDGKVWALDITQTWAVTALLLMAVPIAMVSASLLLPSRWSRRANLAVASLYVLVSIFNAVGESWVVYYWLAVALELVVLGLILRHAWAWSPPASHP